MKRHLVIVTALAVTLCVVPPIFAGKLTESRTIEKSLAFEGGGEQHLIVDNVWGSVVVRGYGGETVEMVAEETVRARTAERIERAKGEVELKIFSRDSEIELYVDGPFRCEDRQERGNCWNNFRDHYEVVYDFEIRVPYDIHLEVHTVTDGDIEVTDVRGDFVIHNVNGSIDLQGMAGSGEAVTVNGPVLASFVSNPESDSHFETVNGKIDVSFQSDLSADLEMVARWGELWSEYEVEPLPSKPPTQRTKGGRTIIEVSRSTRVRVDDGGPILSFETLNGNIYVRKGTRERGEEDA